LKQRERLVNELIQVGNRARFNDWLLEVTFYRTTARTAHSGTNGAKKQEAGKIARREVLNARRRSLNS